MTESLVLPPCQLLGIARNGDDAVAIFRATKERIGLSNRHCDELAGFIEGHIDKLLGPTGAKKFGPYTFTAMNHIFAIKWIAVVDIDQAKVMEQYWEDRQRDASNVRAEPNRVSKKLIERAKPHVLKANGAAGGKARAAKLSARQLSEIGRKGGRSRWRNWRKRKRAERESATA